MLEYRKQIKNKIKNWVEKTVPIGGKRSRAGCYMIIFHVCHIPLFVHY